MLDEMKGMEQMNSLPVADVLIHGQTAAETNYVRIQL